MAADKLIANLALLVATSWHVCVSFFLPNFTFLYSPHVTQMKSGLGSGKKMMVSQWGKKWGNFLQTSGGTLNFGILCHVGMPFNQKHSKPVSSDNMIEIGTTM